MATIASPTPSFVGETVAVRQYGQKGIEIHNFKSCRACGKPVTGNRLICQTVECQRAAGAARKARSRAKKAAPEEDRPAEAAVPVDLAEDPAQALPRFLFEEYGFRM